MSFYFNYLYTALVVVLVENSKNSNFTVLDLTHIKQESIVLSFDSLFFFFFLPLVLIYLSKLKINSLLKIYVLYQLNQ